MLPSPLRGLPSDARRGLVCVRGAVGVRIPPAVPLVSRRVGVAAAARLLARVLLRVDVAPGEVKLRAEGRQRLEHIRQIHHDGVLVHCLEPVDGGDVVGVLIVLVVVGSVLRLRVLRCGRNLFQVVVDWHPVVVVVFRRRRCRRRRRRLALRRHVLLVVLLLLLGVAVDLVRAQRVRVRAPLDGPYERGLQLADLLLAWHPHEEHARHGCHDCVFVLTAARAAAGIADGARQWRVLHQRSAHLRDLYRLDQLHGLGALLVRDVGELDSDDHVRLQHE